MKPTFNNSDHLSGFIDAFIYLYDLHQSAIDEDYSLSYKIIKIEKTYNVKFTWQGKQFLVRRATELEPPEYDNDYLYDSFMIREDESISKLEQFVTDTLQYVVSTDLND